MLRRDYLAFRQCVSQELRRRPSPALRTLDRDLLHEHDRLLDELTDEPLVHSGRQAMSALHQALRQLNGRWQFFANTERLSALLVLVHLHLIGRDDARRYIEVIRTVRDRRACT
jgi:hypothetical protein